MNQKNKKFFFWVWTFAFMAFATTLFAEEPEDYKILREIVQNEFQKELSAQRGTDLTGVIRQFKTSDKKIAIVLAACLDTGPEIDTALFQKLEEKKIPASLFLDQGWREKHSDKVKTLILSGQIRIENHGAMCRPLSVDGKGIKDHPGTASVETAFEEIEKNARGIEALTGRLPMYFKSGYSYYDDVALKIVTVLGYSAVEGDLKLRSNDVATDAALDVFLNRVVPGSMLVIPANRPGTADIWMPKLLAGLSRRGYVPVALEDVLNVTDEDR